MFRKRKKTEPSSLPRVAAEDFTRRLCYESCRAANYQLYRGLQQDVLLPKLERHLAAMLAGEVDDANGDFLDSLIFAPAREALPDLNRQRHDHMEALRRIIARREADRMDFQKLLEQRQQELAELERAHEKTCRLIAKYSEDSL